MPAEEIGFIHDAKTDAQKLTRFQKMNEGKLRFLMGSTDKMGTGVNAQKLLVAQHHIDPPRYMRPDEVEQRDGRILRHGNTNPEVRIYRYVTEPSPDAFAWGGIERKAGFITQITHGDLTTRQMDDIGEVVLGYAEMKAAATGDPAIIELVGVEAELNKMESLERSHSDKLTGNPVAPGADAPGNRQPGRHGRPSRSGRGGYQAAAGRRLYHDRGRQEV